MSNYIPVFYLDVITYPCPNPDAGLADLYMDRLVQERCNSSALAMELRLSCTNPSICKRI